MNKNKNLGFTLAEVLIVIGIIGVVAALTLPNLNHATGDKERVTRVKKIYSALNEAFDRAQAIYGDESTWYNDIQNNDLNESYKRFGARITEFLKISKNCAQEKNLGCFSSEYVKNSEGENSYYLDSAGVAGPPYDYRVITSDNMSLLFNQISKRIIVDIDGPNKGANTDGKDIFWFSVKDNLGVVPGFEYNGSYDCSGFTANDIKQCSATWIIQNDNADYLKADSTGKCNDSDIVLNWTTNTSCH